MLIKVDSMVRIFEPTKEIKNYIKENLKFANPEVQKKQAMGFWCGNIPKEIKLYSKDGDNYILPLGVIDDIWNIHNDLKDYNIDFGKHEKLKFPENNLKLYDYQEEAVEYMIKAKRGILESKCGSGKSIMGLEIIRRIGYKALIIVQTKEILDQFVNYLKNVFNMSKGEYGIIAAGKVEIGSLVTIALRQTLVNVDLLQYKNEWGTIIVDECFSGDTEILTEKGFVRFDKLDKKNKVAQYNEDGTLNFINPIRYIEKNVSEFVSFKYKDIEIKTTLNHNMIAKNRNNSKKIYKIKAKDFLDKKMQDYYMINTAIINDNVEQSLTPIQKIGIMLQADGTIYHIGKKETTWRLDFSKQKKIDEFKKICKEAEIEYKGGKKRDFKNKKWNSSYSFRIKLPNKNYKILTNFLEIPKNKKYALEIINEIKKWDAYITKHNVIEYDTTIQENAEFIQTVAIMCGLKCNKIMKIERKQLKHKNVYRLYIDTTQNIYYQRFKKEIIKKNMKAYCVEVPSNMIVCRKDGFVFISGNCQNVAGSVTKVTQYQKILSNLVSEYRIGLSATGYRVDGFSKSLYAIMNKVKYRIPEEAISNKVIKANIQPIYTSFEIPEEAQKFDGTIDYTKLPTCIATDETRNNLILNMIKEEEKQGNYCLVLSDRLEGLEILHNQLPNSLFINGKMTTKKAKLEREEAILKMRNKESHILMATFSLAKEGLDIKPLNRLFLIAPTKNSIVLIQSTGRIERQDEGKKTPIVYDFIDNDIYFEKAWKARKTIYKKNNNKILDK